MHKKRKINYLSYYAKILIVISLTLLLYGLFLNYQNGRKLYDPIDDVISNVDKENESTVTITTSDGSEVVPGNTIVGDDTPKNDSGTVSGDNNARTTTPEDTNNTLRNEIEKTFGVSVRYGDETIGYSVGGFDTIPIEDVTVVHNQLTYLKDTLSLYPKGFFNEIRNGGIPLSIYLIYSYSNQNITGITDSSYTYAVISIAAEHPFEESFYHESYHYIERYLFKRGVNFNTWDSFNPNGFNYGVIDQKLSYAYGLDENSPFVNDYAQTAATEDRASTFEYMMASSKASCLNKGTVVHAKAVQMSLTIETVLNSVKPDVVEYWERYL